MPMTELWAGVGGGKFSWKIAFTSMVGGIPPEFDGSVALDGDFTESPPLRFEDGFLSIVLVVIGNSLVVDTAASGLIKSSEPRAPEHP